MSVRRFPVVVAGTIALAVAAAPVASGSYGLAQGASGPTLRVDSSGSAGVGWKVDGQQVSFVVPRSGNGYHGVVAIDVSKRASLALPLAVAVRRTKDGTLYALQQFETASRPVSLDLSRWKGSPTKLTLATDGTHLTGKVTFGGHPVTGTSETPAGQAMRIYVYVDCFGCPGAANKWTQLLGVAPKSDGTFSIYLRSSWVGKRYRASVQGPNVGGQMAPDAQTIISG
jgi:hypothetical protein